MAGTVLLRLFFLWQYRTILFVWLRREILRQFVRKCYRQARACQNIFVQDGGKYPSKRAEKAIAVNCTVLPYICASTVPSGRVKSAVVGAIPSRPNAAMRYTVSPFCSFSAADSNPVSTATQYRRA